MAAQILSDVPATNPSAGPPAAGAAGGAQAPTLSAAGSSASKPLSGACQGAAGMSSAFGCLAVAMPGPLYPEGSALRPPDTRMSLALGTLLEPSRAPQLGSGPAVARFSSRPDNDPGASGSGSGSGSFVGAPSGAAAGASGTGFAATMLLSALMLLCGPRVMRRLVLVHERSRAAAIALIPERPG